MKINKKGFSMPELVWVMWVLFLFGMMLYEGLSNYQLENTVKPMAESASNIEDILKIDETIWQNTSINKELLNSICKKAYEYKVSLKKLNNLQDECLTYYDKQTKIWKLDEKIEKEDK